MSISRVDREIIINSLVKSISQNQESFSVSEFAKEHNITGQSVYRYLDTLIQKGIVRKEKKGRKNRFSLVEKTKDLSFELKGLSEDIVWSKEIKPFLENIGNVALYNLQYAFTEMLNNAIDHSGGTKVNIFIVRNAYQTRITIIDDGIGIFTKIANAMNLEEKRFAVLELAKGKFTTDPESHTGEGIFFSSKVVDEFAIISDDLIFLGSSALDKLPYTSQLHNVHNGTTVFLVINNDHSETVTDVFDRFTQVPESYGFSKTIVPVRLLEYGDDNPLVISRSQAKRLMVRFDRFQNIILDFSGIEEIGQGFADELFRVFVKQHPHTVLVPVNCNEQVSRMIARVTAGGEEM